MSWLSRIGDNIKSAFVTRYRCHKKIMLVGSLYGLLLNKSHANTPELRGLLQSLSFNVSENSLQLAVALQSRIWAKTGVVNYLRNSTITEERIIDYIMTHLPNNLKYDERSVMEKDIITIFNYSKIVA